MKYLVQFVFLFLLFASTTYGQTITVNKDGMLYRQYEDKGVWNTIENRTFEAVSNRNFFAILDLDIYQVAVHYDLLEDTYIEFEGNRVFYNNSLGRQQAYPMTYYLEAVPEPSTFVLGLCGIAGIYFTRKRT